MEGMVIIIVAAIAVSLMFRTMFRKPRRYIRNTNETRYSEKDMARGCIGPIAPQ